LSELEAPEAAEPDLSSDELLLEVPPDAADEPCTLVEPEEEVEPCGHEQFSAGLELDEVPPEALDCEDSVLDEPVLELPLIAGELELLLAGCDELELVDGEVEPLALLDVEGDVLLLGLVEPAALPEPEDWLVCAPCVMVDEGLVVVASWVAVAEPVVALAPPEPTFTPAPTLAPALTSVLLMPTFASTPTFGLTFTPPEGEVLELEPLAALGCELVDPEVLPEPEDWLVCADWSVVEDD
jgi:hypothetical protein